MTEGNAILARYRGALPFTVQERDIDLLLIEQLHVCPDLSAWLLAQAGAPDAEVETARHSVYRAEGETDVLVVARLNGARIAVMIEDKIGAPMQPEQCERYHRRGAALVAEGAVARYVTVLCAPAAYLATVPASERWDLRLPFEALAAAIARIARPGWEWRAAVLTAASGRATRAREADSRASTAYDPAVVALKQAYRAFVLAERSHLIATPQEGRDREYYLSARGLPKGIRFKHAFFRGEVSLILERAWVAAGEGWLAEGAPPEAQVIRHGGELHLRLPVEPLDPAQPLEVQTEVVAAALDRIETLRGWAAGIVATAGRT